MNGQKRRKKRNLPENSQLFCKEKKEKIKTFHSHFSRLPFDWKTPLGYFIAMVIFAEVTFYILCCGVIGVCLLVGSCWLIQAVVQDISQDQNDFNVSKKKWNQNRMEMKITFNNFIDDFSHAKQLSGKRNQFSKLFSIFSFFFI